MITTRRMIAWVSLVCLSPATFAGKMLSEEEKQREQDCEDAKIEIKNYFNSANRPFEFTDSEGKAAKNLLALEDWEKLCTQVHAWTDQIKPNKYEAFKTFLENTLLGVHRIGYGNADFGRNVLKKNSSQILIDFNATIEFELEDYLEKYAYLDRLNLLAEFSQKDISYVLENIQKLIDQCDTDPKALSVLKEKLLEFCNNTTTFSQEEKASIIALIQHIKDENAIETEEMKKISLEISVLYEQEKEILNHIQNKEREFDEIQKALKEGEAALTTIERVRSQGLLNKSKGEAKEEEVLALRNRVDPIREKIKQLKEKQQEIKTQIRTKNSIYEPLLIQEIKRTQADTSSKETMGSSKIKEILQKIDTLSKERDALAQEIMKQEIDLAKMTKDLWDDRATLTCLTELRAAGELDRHTVEAKEDEVVALEVQADTAEGAIVQAKKKQAEISAQISQCVATCDVLRKNSNMRAQEEKKEKHTEITLEDFLSYTDGKPGRWQKVLNKEELDRILALFTHSPFNVSRMSVKSNHAPVISALNRDTMAAAIVNRKDIEKLDHASLTIISENNRQWVATLIKTYEQSQTDAPLSTSFLNHLLHYDAALDQYDLFSDAFLNTIGRVSPHHVTEDFIAILPDRKIPHLLEKYAKRPHKDRVFSESVQEALEQRGFKL